MLIFPLFMCRVTTAGVEEVLMRNDTMMCNDTVFIF